MRFLTRGAAGPIAVIALFVFGMSPAAALFGPDDGFEEPEPPEVEPPDIDPPEVEPPEVEAPETEPPEVEMEESGDDDGGDSGSDDDNSGHGGGDESDDGDDGDDDDDFEADVQAHLSEPMSVELDAEGREFVASEVLFAGSSAELSSAESAGYRVISSAPLGENDRRLARLLIPASRNVSGAISELQSLAPTALVTINNAYRMTQANMRRVRRGAARAPGVPSGALVGVIDTGADGASPSLIATRGFGSAGYVPRQHGSAVASIVARTGARTQVADVFGPSRSGEPYASASAIIEALRWMIDTGVPVINISIEGPRNAILESAIHDAVARGHLVVAAAGNGGPLALPAFPGAYEGVIAVTAVDDQGRAYLRANRGDYVDFAALGVQVPIDAGEAHASVTGTSFAAPLVAAALAAHLPEPSSVNAARAVEGLRSRAIDRGAPGRDPIYGWGEIRRD